MTVKELINELTQIGPEHADDEAIVSYSEGGEFLITDITVNQDKRISLDVTSSEMMKDDD